MPAGSWPSENCLLISALTTLCSILMNLLGGAKCAITSPGWSVFVLTPPFVLLPIYFSS